MEISLESGKSSDDTWTIVNWDLFNGTIMVHDGITRHRSWDYPKWQNLELPIRKNAGRVRWEWRLSIFKSCLCLIAYIFCFVSFCFALFCFVAFVCLFLVCLFALLGPLFWIKTVSLNKAFCIVTTVSWGVPQYLDKCFNIEIKDMELCASSDFNPIWPMLATLTRAFQHLHPLMVFGPLNR